MTVQVDPGPGSTNWTTSAAGFTFAGQSAKWTVTVAGVSTFVYGYERTSPIDCDRWAAGGGGEDACTQFGTDDAASTSVAVTRVGGFTSAKVYPRSAVVSSSLAGGVLTLTLKKNRHVIIEANGSRQHTLRISSCPLREAVPGGSVNWTSYGPRTVTGISSGTNRFTFGSAHGLSANWKVKLWSTGTLPTAVGGDIDNDTNYFVRVVDATNIELARTSGGAAIDLTGIGSGTITVYRSELTSGVLYFPPGLHRIGRLFDLYSNTTVYLDHGAVVVGSFDVRETNGVLGMGLGVQSPTTHSSETVFGLSSFYDQITYAAWFGWDDIQYPHDNEVRDITIIGYPFYMTLRGVNRWVRTKIHSPWYWSCDGYKSNYKSNSDRTSSVTGCFGQCADDALDLTEWFGTFTMSDTMLTTTQNSIVLHGYFPNPLYISDDGEESSQLVQNSTFMHYGSADTGLDQIFPVLGQNVIFRSWVDGSEAEKGEGNYNITLRNNEVVGPVKSRVFSIANRLHPFSVSGLGTLRRDGFGEIAGIAVDGLTVEEAPGQLSILEGWDWENTPRDIAFSRWTVVDNLVNAGNWESYVEQNAFPYFITIGGQPVVTAVDICNTALDIIGHAKRITEISPPDGSAEAEVCAEHYTSCVNELLDAHNWNFATVKRELVALSTSDDPAWDYRYQLPEGMLRIISILPADATDNNYTVNAAVPVDYEIHADEDDEVRIYTDLEDAWIRFVKYVESPGLFSPTFLEALQWKLASRFAGPLIKGTEGAAERDRCTQQYMMAMGKATQNDARQQRRVSQTTISSWHKR